MKVLNETEFKSKVFDYESSTDFKYKGELPAIIDFYADWCPPCRALAPILEEISDDYKGRVQIYKVNTEESPNLSAAFGIRSIPTLLFIPQQGDPVLSPGFAPKAELVSAIEEILKPQGGQQ